MTNTDKISWFFMKVLCQECDDSNTDFPQHKLIERYGKFRDVDTQTMYDIWKSIHKEESIFEFFEGRAMVLRLNDFPYNFDVGIDHYILWLDPYKLEYPYEARMNKVHLEYTLAELNKIYSNYEVLHFRNSITDRSINMIPHYHVLVKSR